MKIVFIGSVLLSEKILEQLIFLKEEVVGVISKNQSAFNSDFRNISLLAQNSNIPSFNTSNINNSETVDWIKSKIPDIIFCFGWSSLLKSQILNIPKIGVIGYHPSLLPLNRGRHPLIWAKVLGLNTTGSTFFFMDEGSDTGDILNQKKFEITFEDTANSIYNKMIETTLIQLKEFLPDLKTKKFKRIKQNIKRNYWRKRNHKDGLIDFRMESEAICNLVRGLSKPYIGSHCLYKGMEIKIWKIKTGNNMQKNIEPGKIIKIDKKKIEVKTGSTSVILTKHEFEFIPEINEYIL